MKVEKSKRARMGLEKTPNGPTPRKRKRATTRARALKDVLNTMNETTGPEQECTEMEAQLELGSPLEKETKSEMLRSTSPAAKRVIIASNPSIKSSLKGPSPRWGHSLCMLSENDAILIGGQGDKQQISKDASWHLDLGRATWDALETSLQTGQKPEARTGHTAVYDPTVRSIYLYGGSKNLKWFSDVNILDVDEMKWQLVKANGKAPTRAYHSATLYRHELWIFGGVYPRPQQEPDGCSNDIIVYSPIQEGWYTPIVMGDKPSPRSGHSATLLQDKLVVFGGWDAPVCFNDLFVLDLCIVEWSQPTVNGTPPSPRSWVGSCALSGNRVLIHGGYNGNDALDDSFIFNLDTLTWACVKLEPPIAARAGHALLCLPYKHENEEKDEVLIFGGGDNEGSFYQDLVCVMIPFENEKRLTDL